jgi:type IV pilus assembly protein PilY1
MKITRLFRTALIGSALAAPAVFAEDIDIFMPGSNQAGSPPNVLLFLDNTSNWSANNQAWNKTEVNNKCKGDKICEGYVDQIFGSKDSLNQGQVELGALMLVLNELVCKAETPLDINLGLMLINNTDVYGGNADNSGKDSQSPSGGLIRQAVSRLDAARCPGFIAALQEVYDKVQDPTYKVPQNSNYGGAMFEAFKYFGGYSNPENASKNQPGSPTGHISFGPKTYEIPGTLEDPNAFADPDKRTTYKSPIGDQSGCNSKNYLLLIGNGFPKADIEWPFDTLKFPYQPADYAFATGSQPRLADVWAKFLATTDVSPNPGQQMVSTYVLNVYNDKEDAEQTKLLKSMARNGAIGGSGYYEVGGNLKTLIDAFKDFFNSISAVNSVFASSALPVSTNVRGTHLNQVYMGMFRPSESPRWFGNLKLYQLAVDPLDPNKKNVVTVDSTGTTQIEDPNGFIKDKAVSFWTNDTQEPLNFWSFRCSSGIGDPALCGKPASPSDKPDGAVVEKGAAAQMLRQAFTPDSTNSNPNRTLYTCVQSGGACQKGQSFESFDTTTIKPTDTALQAKFRATDSAYVNPATGQSGRAGELADIVNWVRGVDNKDIPEGSPVVPGTPLQVRPSIVGDVLHLRPVIINYNRSAAKGCLDKSQDKDVVVYYGGNDGILHALQGGKDAGILNVGNELWGFVPPEFFGVYKRLRDGSPIVKLPASVAATPPDPATSTNKPYFIDGALSAYTKDANRDCRLTGGDKAYLFMTLRRGGRFIYAFDVIDPKNPKFLWKKSNKDAGYGELGQTWSQLTPITLADGRVAVIFGAGYDPGADDASYSSKLGYGIPPAFSANPAIGRTMGRGIFVVDAKTGDIIRKFGPGDTVSGPTNSAGLMPYSIPSDLAVLSEDDTGFVTRAYVGDTGGNVWKIDLTDQNNPTADPKLWSVKKLASLGTHDPTKQLGLPATGQTNARRFVYTPDIVKLDGGGYGILIGSGDREKPRDTTVKNSFYMIKDLDKDITVECQDSNNCDLFNATNTSLVPDDAKGWYIDLLGKGEKTVGSAVTLSGTTLFPTNEPPSSSGASCSTNLGIARMYAVSYVNGAASLSEFGGSRSTEVPGGGFPPSPVPVVVELDGTHYKAALYGPGSLSFGITDPGRRAFSYYFKETLD